MFLSIDDLTIKVRGNHRDDYLWEIGSGSNWLAYHLALSLSLQSFFMSLADSPIPHFLVYDQPSQVYFPYYPGALDTQLRDEDIEAVRRVYTSLSLATERSHGKLQIIVLDHARENVWGKINNIHFVENWRDGKKLIPLSWLA